MIKIFLILFSSIGLALSFFPFRLSWLFAWFGFVPFFFAIACLKNKFKVFVFSYLEGILFWLFTVYWLVYVTFLGYFLLVLYLGLYFAIFGLFFYKFKENNFLNIFFLSSLWVIEEFLRSYLFTGFGWALLGYSQYKNLALIQLADIGGVWLVSFLVMAVNLNLYYLFQETLIKKTKYILCILFLIGITLLYGYYQLFSVSIRSEFPRQSFKISLIQANIPQEIKWKILERDFILNKYFSLTKKALKDNPDLVIWSEASLPCVLEEEPIYFERVKDFVKEDKINLLLGAVTYRNGLYYNSAILVSADGEIIERYDKIHLVPFGEYIPLRKIFGFLETIVPIGDFAKGNDYTVFKLSTSNYGLPTAFSVLICFEDIFPEISQEFVKRGAGFLVNITNDAWFKKSPAAYQHLSASVFRAVENRRFIVRCANTGISGFILPTGKIKAVVEDKKKNPLFVEGFISQRIKKTLLSSFYNRYPYLFIEISFFIFVYGIINRLWKEKGL
jgi:apolipoprotein N-acyltransferase